MNSRASLAILYCSRTPDGVDCKILFRYSTAVLAARMVYRLNFLVLSRTGL